MGGADLVEAVHAVDDRADVAGRRQCCELCEVGAVISPALRARILAARAVMLEHPWLPPALESPGLMTPALGAWVDGNIAAMHAGGLSYDLIHHAMHTLGSRQFGFSQELMLDDPSGDTSADRAAAEALAAVMPNVRAMLENVVHDGPDSIIGWCDDQAEFEFALDVLLEGLDRRG